MSTCHHRVLRRRVDRSPPFERYRRSLGPLVTGAPMTVNVGVPGEPLAGRRPRALDDNHAGRKQQERKSESKTRHGHLCSRASIVVAPTAAASDTFRATRRPSCVSVACQTSPIPPQLSQALDHLGLHAHQRTVGATVDDVVVAQPFGSDHGLALAAFSIAR